MQDFAVRQMTAQHPSVAALERAAYHALEEVSTGREAHVPNFAAIEQALVGHDLHEEVCQDLAATATLAACLAAAFEKKSAPEAPRLREIAALVNAALEKTRRVATSLNVAALDGGGFYAALKNLAAHTSPRIPCIVEYPAWIELPVATSVHLYRIAHEAVLNALRHSGAQQITVAFCAFDNDAVVSIEDDGRGFSRNRVRPGSGGLHAMSEHARRINGVLTIESAPMHGTRICCTLPIQRH
jgi:signal transduction histidine kinase